MEWLNKLETKDLVTVYISVVALGFSIISTYVTLRQKKHETMRTLRTQLTGVLDKMVALNLENAKLPPFGPLPPGTPSNIRSFLNDQRRFLVRQATYIMDDIEPLVSSFEYLLIAVTYDHIDHVDQARRYFEKARECAEDDINRGIITRSYARFLFNQGEHARARKKFEEAVGFFSGGSDRMKEYRGDTYVRWAAVEFEWERFKEAGALFERAELCLKSKLSPVSRDRSLHRLGDRIRELNSAPPSRFKPPTRPGGGK